MTPDHSDKGHSEVGGSSAPRFFRCAGSVRLSRGLPNPDTEHSLRGDAAHDDAAFVLNFGGEPTHEDAEAIKEYVALVEDRRRAYGAKAVEYIEAAFHRPEIDERMWGQLDWATVSPTHGCLIDYKHGEGVPVEAEGNEQLLYYASEMAMRHPEVEKWELIICQPRAGGTKRWPVDRDYILNWIAKELIPAFKRTLDPDAPLVPGEKQCQFCPAALNNACPALHKQLAVIREIPPPAMMSDAEVDRLLGMVPTLRKAIKAVEADALRRAMAGVEFENAKLVESKTDRVWREDAPELYWSEPTRMSPAQVEKLSPEGKQFVKQYAIKPQGYPTLAPMSDRRPRISPPGAKEIYAEALEQLAPE